MEYELRQSDKQIRSNVGFLIIASRRIGEDTEKVFGVNTNGLFATGKCIGGKDYIWEKYSLYNLPTFVGNILNCSPLELQLSRTKAFCLGY